MGKAQAGFFNRAHERDSRRSRRDIDGAQVYKTLEPRTKKRYNGTSVAASGTWVLVKNVHLAPQWLQSLEKRLTALTPDKDFRPFLSMETSPKIPVNLIHALRVLMYEQLAGIRVNTKDSLSVLVPRANTSPVEQA